MKKQILATAAALLFSALASTQTHAQQAAVANIPFEFQVGNKTMPAGEYKVQRAQSSNDGLELLQRTDSSASIFALTERIDGTGMNTDPKLVFHCYGNECFLSEIWLGSTSGRQLSPSRREREASRAAAENEMAVVVLPLSGKS
jgi:hypothetical protein